jgi:hypothetical protein
MLAPVGFGHEPIDVYTDHLRLAITKHALCRPVESLNRTAVVNDDDRVHGRIQQRFERIEGVAPSCVFHHRMAF